MHTAASTQELPENQQKCPGAPESENASKCGNLGTQMAMVFDGSQTREVMTG